MNDLRPSCQATRLSRFPRNCYDDFAAEASRSLLWRGFLGGFGRIASIWNRAKPHKHWRLRISLIWRVGT
jgi:hypothetical protein